MMACLRSKRWFLLLGLALVAMLISATLSGGTRGASAQGPTCAPGPHRGTITESETWCLADSPHIIDNWLTIDPGATVTIEAGSVVQTNYKITILGGLVAIGTANEPIVFTSVDDSGPTQWRGLRFMGADASGDLRHTIIRNAGYNDGEIGYDLGCMVAAKDLVNHTLRIERSEIRSGHDTNRLNGFFAGLFLENSNAVIVDNLFTELGDTGVGDARWPDFPAFIHGQILNLTMSGNVLKDNVRDRILFGALYAQPDPTLIKDMTLGAEQPWEIDADLVVNPGVTLTIQPGASLMGVHNTNLEIHGHLEAVGTPQQPITLRSVAGTDKDQWTGLVFRGGTGSLSYVTLQNGGGDYGLGMPETPGDEPICSDCVFPPIHIYDVQDGEVRIEHSTIQGNGNTWYWRTDGIMNVYNSRVVLVANHFLDNGVAMDRADHIPGENWGIIAWGTDTDLTMTGNTFENNLGWNVFSEGRFQLDGNVFRDQDYGVKIYQNLATALTNNVFADLSEDALYLGSSAQATAAHTTLARNAGNAVHVHSGANLTLTNSILAENATGVYLQGTGVATLNQTLWDRNTTRNAGTGTLVDDHAVTGAAGFAGDGYHLTAYSTALERGADAGVTVDIDGEVRPAPAGTLPDLGADEYQRGVNAELTAEKVAFEPKGMLSIDAETGEPAFTVVQGYLLRFFHGSEVPDPLAVTITDTLPPQLTLKAETHTPEMTFSANGQKLTWQTVGPVAVNQSAEVTLETCGHPQPGDVLVNEATIQAGDTPFELEAERTVPFYPPLITSIADGEYCYRNDQVNVEGVALGSAFIRVYENGEEVATTAANAKGQYAVSYSSLRADEPITVTARACLASEPDRCSDESDPVHLIPANSFWDPQRSYWEGTPTVGPMAGQHLVYSFRNADSGAFSTDEWQIPGVYGFYNTQMHLYVCEDSEPRVQADDQWYTASWSGGFWTFELSLAHRVNICDEDYTRCTGGNVLIDPDGYVFDVMKGFDPANPAANAIEGVTVTCMAWIPKWGGWVPWPAQLYDSQQNPQVTGEDSYFAFFTPPGLYYLRVEGAEGYQSWRSPVIEVVNEIVHANVPLTPETSATVQVGLTPDGPAQSTVHIIKGQAVEWVYQPGQNVAAEQIVAETEDPTIQVRSDVDPLSDTSGFDSGMLVPNAAYRRQFTKPGTYAYTDGQGHAGTVIVERSPFLFVPLVRR